MYTSLPQTNAEFEQLSFGADRAILQEIVQFVTGKLVELEAGMNDRP